MGRRFLVTIALAVSACATANGEGPVPIDAAVSDSRIVTPDTRVIDVSMVIDAVPDAPPPDAPPDAAPDAHVGPDACIPTGLEKCNGIDDNCDGQVDEGFDVGADCTAGMGACMRSGKTICSADGLSTVCGATPGDPGAHELCGNGIDDNCNGLIDEGFSDLGKVCTSGTGACKAAGTYVCSTDKLSLVCDATPVTPGPELCGNGIDDNCNGQVDEGFSNIGMPCSAGVGACLRMGNYVCSADLLSESCNAVPAPAGPELCGDGIDNNCDGQVDEGFPMLGMPCTAGTGACLTGGAYVCSADKLSAVCSAVARTPSPDICDGIDNDCDPTTPDGSQDPNLGLPCGAGPNDDCPTGTYVACSSAGALVCSDTTSQNTANDINNCGTCGLTCSNAHGGTSCVSGTCRPSCSGQYFDCDGNPADGCETFIGGTGCAGTFLGTLSGDSTGDSPTQDQNGNDFVVASGTTSSSDWYYVYIQEDQFDIFTDTYLSGQAYLYSPSGVNYDLYAYCYNCGVAPSEVSTSTVTGGNQYQDTTPYRHEDSNGDDSSYWVIEVRYVGGNACAPYQLYINSDYAVDSTTCF